MNLLLVLPILLPLGIGGWLFARADMPLCRQRRISLIGAGLQLGVSIALLTTSARGQVTASLIGDWPVPYGITLAADRLSALMLTLTSALAVAALAHLVISSDPDDRRGHQFHTLFQLQLFGLAGAFLTADLFNLFVFFEVLLIASYGLLVQGGGAARSRSALHYVVLNMVGSSLFLMGAAALYAATGTLNLAALSERLQTLPPPQAPLVGAGLMLLAGTFSLKAALVPLHAWLVPAYSAALAPVAAVFAIMTKVGIYALLRLFMLLSVGTEAAGDPWSQLPIQPVLATGALPTLAAGAVGTIAARGLRGMTGSLILVSVGTLVTGVAAGTPATIAASLYYLIHTTLVTAGLFLLIDVISQGREERSLLQSGVQRPPGAWPAALFLIAALAIAGVPPLSGFLGKALILQSLQGVGGAAPYYPDWELTWSAVLVSSLLVVIGLSRAGITLFWRGKPAHQAESPARIQASAAAALIASSPLLTRVRPSHNVLSSSIPPRTDRSCPRTAPSVRRSERVRAD